MRPILAAAALAALAACGQMAAPFGPTGPRTAEVSTFDALTGDSALAVAALRRDGRIVLGGFNFPPGSAELTEAGQFALRRLGPALAAPAAEGARIAVVGHTDSSGDFAANVALSTARARAIEAALEEGFGIAPDRIVAVGVGPIAPVADNATEAGRALNRRVELVVLD